MTEAELRIIAFLMTSDATRPADLPDWLLATLEGDRREGPSHELITAASLLYARRLHPGIGFHAARSLIAQYADDPARLAELSDRIAAFRLSCCFERLKRSGRFEDVLIDDPFDPDGAVAVKLSEAESRSVDPEPAPRDSRHGPHDFSLNQLAAWDVAGRRAWPRLTPDATPSPPRAPSTSIDSTTNPAGTSSSGPRTRCVTRAATRKILLEAISEVYFVRQEEDAEVAACRIRIRLVGSRSQ